MLVVAVVVSWGEEVPPSPTGEAVTCGDVSTRLKKISSLLHNASPFEAVVLLSEEDILQQQQRQQQP